MAAAACCFCSWSRRGVTFFRLPRGFESEDAFPAAASGGRAEADAATDCMMWAAAAAAEGMDMTRGKC